MGGTEPQPHCPGLLCVWILDSPVIISGQPQGAGQSGPLLMLLVGPDNLCHSLSP